MYEPILQSGWESFLYAAPLVGLLLLSAFKLDCLISAPKGRLRRRCPVTGSCANGEPLGCDPDGRPWPMRRRR